MFSRESEAVDSRFRRFRSREHGCLGLFHGKVPRRFSHGSNAFDFSTWPDPVTQVKNMSRVTVHLVEQLDRFPFHYLRV